MSIDRRTVVKGAAVAWTVPAILTAVAAPAAAASNPPPAPDLNPCSNGTLKVVELDFSTGRSQHLPRGIQVFNLTSTALVISGFVENASNHLVGVGAATTFTLNTKHPGNATFTSAIPAKGSVILRLLTDDDNEASGFLTLTDCGVRYHMKTMPKTTKTGE